MDLLITIINFVVVLGFLILIHEGGHFLAARWAKVWVHEFAVGFGPAVLKRKTAETLYALRAFPIGGYVRMAGETVTSAEGGGEDPEDENANIPKDRMFSSKGPWPRMGIIAAGPLTNILGALLLVILAVALFGATQVETISFTSPDSPAAQAFQEGDIVLSIEGKPIHSTSQISAMISGHGELPLRIGILRSGEQMEVTVTPLWNEAQQRFLIGALFSTARTNHVTSTSKGSFLEENGVLPGDRIVGLGDIQVASYRTLATALEGLRETGGQTTLTLQRGDETYTIPLDLDNHSVEDLFSGLALETPTRRLGLMESVTVGLQQTWGMMLSLYFGIKLIFSGEIPASEALSGPVGIANILSQGLQQGWSSFFYLVAFLSLNLGIINLFPFPALDGSRLVFITIELVRGRPISPEREGMVHQVGFFVLLGLIVLITYNDILRLFR